MRVSVVLLMSAVLACCGLGQIAMVNEAGETQTLSYEEFSRMNDQSFCERVYRCLGIERRYDTPDGVSVYEYKPKLQLHFASATGDAKNDIRIGTGFHTDFNVEPGMDDGMFITLDQRE